MASLICFLFVSTIYASSLPFPPPKPAAFPPATQLLYIDGTYLTDPLVTTAYDYVVDTIQNKSILDLSPSVQITQGDVIYPPNQATACHWGTGSVCIRHTDTPDYKSDITTCPSPYQWGITYDDGPNAQTNPGTPQLLESLSSGSIKATFFVLGASVSLFPEELKKMYAAGHQIAVHTWTHHPLTNLTNIQIVAEIKYTERIIYETIGVIPTFFRPPYGDIDDRVRAIVSALGYKMVLWTTEGMNRDSADTDATVKNLPLYLKNVTKWFDDPVSNSRGFISLEHDATVTTANLSNLVVREFIKSRKSSKLVPMPVSECLNVMAYRAVVENDAEGDEKSWITSIAGIAILSSVGFVLATFFGFVFLRAYQGRKGDQKNSQRWDGFGKKKLEKIPREDGCV
ncbi:chitin deacetylase [Nowakowskiella sp. JEL0407]|nr:chitin deacetylase [Nowakowskiella sp. JEL0407]